MKYLKDQSVVILCALLLWGFLMLWAAPVLGSSFIGFEYVDHYGTQWFYWFAKRCVETWTSPDHTDLFFHPWGKDIYSHTGSNILDAVLSVPFTILLGPVLGYNVFVLFGMLVSAAAFYKLTEDFMISSIARGMSTLFFSAAPFLLFELSEGRPTQAIMIFPLLFLRYMWRSGQEKHWKNPVWAAIFLALSGYQYWFYAFFGGMAALAHGLYLSIRHRDPWVFLRHVGMGGLALLLCLPGALPLVLATESGDVPGLLDVNQWTLAASDPLTKEGTRIGLFLWQPFFRATGFFVQDADGTERFLPTMYVLPWVSLPFVLAWLWRPGRLQRGPVLAMIGVGALMAMGPLILVGNHVLPNMFYVFLLQKLSFLQRLWWPGRAFALVFPFLMLMIGVGLEHLGNWRKKALSLVSVGLTLGWMAELGAMQMAPLTAWDATVPAGYRCLAGRLSDETEEVGAILELPYAWIQAHVYYQIIHGRPIFGGMIEDNLVFTPDEFVSIRKENGFIKRMLELGRMSESTQTWTEEEKQALKDLGYRYIVLQKDAFAIEREDTSLKDNVLKTRVRRLGKELVEMLGRPIYDDARVTIFSPWGYELPCEPHGLPPDDAAHPYPYIDAAERLGIEPDKQIITRWIRNDTPPATEATPNE